MHRALIPHRFRHPIAISSKLKQRDCGVVNELLTALLILWD
jgi:hypothetical protein